jgi:head-tail adaptor
MRAGRQRKRLLLQKPNPTPTIDAEGNALNPWLDVGYIWAELTVPSVLAVSGARGERQEAGQYEQLRPHHVSMRWRADGLPDHNCRFLLGGATVPPARVLVIRDVTDIGERHKELRVDAMEKVY